MVKYLLVSIAAFLLLASCGSKEPTVYTLESLLPVVEQQMGKEILIKGEVTHVCSHSGKRCFVKATNSDETIRIEAGGTIELFDKELLGTGLKVKGIVREQRIEEASIVEKEATLEAKKEEAESEEEQAHCSTEQNSIDKMRQWMKDNGKDYYAIYFIEGIEIVK